MTIRIQVLPAADQAFAARVREAIERVSSNGHVNGQLEAASETDLRRALSHIRAQYPDVWIRRQDSLASIDGVETWYAFRDEGSYPLDRVRARG